MSAIHSKVYKISGERLWRSLIVLDFGIIEPASTLGIVLVYAHALCVLVFEALTRLC